MTHRSTIIYNPITTSIQNTTIFGVMFMNKKFFNKNYIIIACASIVIIGIVAFIMFTHDNTDVQSDQLPNSNELTVSSSTSSDKATLTPQSSASKSVYADAESSFDAQSTVDNTSLATPVPTSSHTPSSKNTNTEPTPKSTVTPQETAMPQETAQSVSFEWKEWSEWMEQLQCFDAIDALPSIPNPHYPERTLSIEIDTESCIQYCEIIGEPAWIYRYRDTTIDWGGWIENAENLSEPELNQLQNGATRFIQFQYDSSQDVPPITHYRLGNLVYLSDWSTWMPGEQPQSGGYWEQFEHEYDVKIDEANSNWSAWSEASPSSNAMNYQQRHAMRFRWRYVQ